MCNSTSSFLKTNPSDKNTLNATSLEIIRHETTKQGLLAYERIDNDYLWPIENHGSAVLAESPQPIMSMPEQTTLTYSPITVWNDWPEKLSNISIFPWLLPHAENSRHAKFSCFVKSWYQSACAIVYYPQSGDPKIIGSGALVRDGLVATARHNFENFPQDKLFIRFFYYSVSQVNNHFLRIREQYLDVPIINRYPGNYGIDAGYLEIAMLCNKTIVTQYSKILPIEKSLFDHTPLSAGHYAMFHFSGGKPQVSIGKIETQNVGMQLHDNISIQAGPGASGAAVIWKGLNTTLGGGISIYRIIDNGCIRRRIINFSEFYNLGYLDKISAPYYFNANFQIIPSTALNESGYEFLRYRLEDYRGRRVDHPDNDVYKLVNENHSNHHIIPISDLLYLWDYFHKLDAQTIRDIIKIVKSECNERLLQGMSRLNKYVLDYYPDSNERAFHLEDGKKELNKKISQFSEKRYQELYRENLNKKYAQFYLLFKTLSPNYQNNSSTNFAWSFWNLFKGWKKDYRTDDPASEYSSDFSEKIRPKLFTRTLWHCVKNPNDGLYHRIQQLKSTSVPNSANEATLFNCMHTLANTWSRQTKSGNHPHQYNLEEWEKMGIKNGHDIYRVKPQI